MARAKKTRATKATKKAAKPVQEELETPEETIEVKTENGKAVQMRPSSYWTKNRLIDAAKRKAGLKTATTRQGTILVGPKASVVVEEDGAYRNDVPRAFTCKMPFRDVAKLFQLEQK